MLLSAAIWLSEQEGQRVEQVTWWGTSVEAVSAFNRLHREATITSAARQQALARLHYLRDRWKEVQPSDDLRTAAERLLSVHKLKAADALQLSAALTWCGNRASGRRFVAADQELLAAAEAEGFLVVPIL